MASVIVHRLPAGSLQPTVALDASGQAHVLFFSGEQRGGNLFYCKLGPDGSPQGKPVRVNTAEGTVRGGGGRIALGAHHVIHVAWNAWDRNHRKLSVAYAHSRPDGSFTPQRTLMAELDELDGECAVAADAHGKVIVGCHAVPPGAKQEAVFLTVSNDSGETFKPASRISPPGACECCDLSLALGAGGRVAVLYRSQSADGKIRNVELLTSTDGRTFGRHTLDVFHGQVCPESRFDVQPRANGWLAAWEHGKTVSWAIVGTDGAPQSRGLTTAGRYPALSANARGDVLMASRGANNTMTWQLRDAAGKVTNGTSDGLPRFSFPAAWSRADGSFVILY